MESKRIKQAKALFVLFVALMAFSAAVVVTRVITAIVNGNTLPDGSHAPKGSIVVRDYNLDDRSYIGVQTIPGSIDGCSAVAYPSEGTICFVPSNGQMLVEAPFVWSQICLVLNYVSLLASCMMGLLCVISFYRSFMKKDKFNLVFIKYMGWIGVSIMAASLFNTVHVALSSVGVNMMLAGVDAPVNLQFEFDITKLFFGLGILFLAMVLRTNRKLQEEQELTI